MRILYLTQIENCLESQSAYNVFFTDFISEDFINKFSDIGKIVYKKIDNNTYFRVIVKGKFTIKGFVDKDNFRILVADNIEINEIKEIIILRIVPPN